MFASGLKVFGLEQMVVRSTQSEVSGNHQTFLWMLRHLLALNLPAHVMYEGIEHPLISPELWRWIPYQSHDTPLDYLENSKPWSMVSRFEFSISFTITDNSSGSVSHYVDINIRDKRTNVDLFHLALFLFSYHQNIWLIAKHKIVSYSTEEHYRNRKIKVF